MSKVEYEREVSVAARGEGFVAAARVTNKATRASVLATGEGATKAAARSAAVDEAVRRLEAQAQAVKGKAVKRALDKLTKYRQKRGWPKPGSHGGRK